MLQTLKGALGSEQNYLHAAPEFRLQRLVGIHHVRLLPNFVLFMFLNI